MTPEQKEEYLKQKRIETKKRNLEKRLEQNKVNGVCKETKTLTEAVEIGHSCRDFVSAALRRPGFGPGSTAHSKARTDSRRLAKRVVRRGRHGDTVHQLLQGSADA